MMKKRIFSLLLINVLCLLMAVPTFAQDSTDEEHPPRVVDEADVLSSEEEENLSEIFDEISERQQFDAVVVVAESTEGQSTRDYAADYYDYNDYGIGEDKDGILLLVSMQEREFFILTTGYGIEAFSDSYLDQMSNAFLSDLSAGNYESAFETFAQNCDDHLTYVKVGGSTDGDSENYYEDGEYEETYEVEEESKFPGILSTLIIAVLLAFLPVSVMEGNLKSVKAQRAAGVYIKSGSQKITNQKDIFLYHIINRVPKPKEEPSKHRSGGSSTFRGSSGRSHGGRGGGF